MSKIRVGVIGCGMIADLTVWGYTEDDRVEIRATCDSNIEKAEEKASGEEQEAEGRIRGADVDEVVSKYNQYDSEKQLVEIYNKLIENRISYLEKGLETINNKEE